MKLKGVMSKSKYTEDDYKNKCKELGLIYVGNHKDKKRGTIIEFICEKHRNKGAQFSDWSHFRKYTIGCTYCSGRHKTNADIEKEIKNKDVELISEYTGNEKPIKCRCKKCNNTWITLPKTLITNGAGCPVCGKEKSSASEMKDNDKFLEDMYNANPDIEILGKYTGSHRKIKCKCKICGTEWFGYPSNLLNKSAGCPTCNISMGEREMVNTLKDLGIDYIQQYSIRDGIHKNPLRFDAYNEKHRIAFEYNGRQHYYPVDFAGRGKEWADKNYRLTCERDKCKIDYCNQHDIKIIIIPYWERDNMKDIIATRWKELALGLAS